MKKKLLISFSGGRTGARLAAIHRLYRWFAKHFICPTISNGHKPESFLYEDNWHVYTHRCSRCHSILGMGNWKGLRSYPPPNSTPEQVREWEKYFDNNIKHPNTYKPNKITWNLKEQKVNGDM